MNTINTLSADKVRKKAEDILKLKHSNVDSKMSEVEVLKLIHELEVHQIQLEMQNSELELSKELAEVNSQKYTALYDFAPTGYFTLSKTGLIKRLNLHGAQLLGKERVKILDKNFEVFVCYDSLPVYNQFLDNVISSGNKVNCELKIRCNETTLYVYVSAVLSENKDDCLLSMVNITDRKSLEIELKESEMRFNVLFDDAPDTMFLADTETKKIVDANNAACRLFKKEKHELIGCFQHELHPKHALDLSKNTFNSHIIQSKSQGNSSFGSGS